VPSAQQLAAGRGHAVFLHRRQPCDEARALGVSRDARTQGAQQRHQRVVAELDPSRSQLDAAPATAVAEAATQQEEKYDHDEENGEHQPTTGLSIGWCWATQNARRVALGTRGGVDRRGVTEQERRNIAGLRRRIAELNAEALVREGRITELVADAVERESEIRDLEAVRDVLAPAEVPARAGLEIECAFAPAAVIAGPDDDSTLLAVGDVAGKGIEAARRATFVRTSLATFAGFVDEPCRLLELSNQVLIERTGTSSTFVTAVAVVLHPREGRLDWASAGHPPPLRLGSGELLNGRRPSPPLGVTVELTCDAGHEQLTAGDGLLLYTDGVTEAHRPRRELFGERRLVDAVRDLAHGRPDAVVRRLTDELHAHAGDALSDDLCIIAARLGQA
jgi:serine phosphatase RsbU (regulator of sigma subunit)